VSNRLLVFPPSLPAVQIVRCGAAEYPAGGDDRHDNHSLTNRNAPAHFQKGKKPAVVA
jgi:hypothetical protein